MKITICGSIAFYDEMIAMQQRLEALGHGIKLPPHEVHDKDGQPMRVHDYYELRQKATDADAWVWQRKKELILEHFRKVEWCDAVLILNYEKRGVANYIGANTLMEMGLALYLHKKIFLLNPIPDLAYREEIVGMHPIVLDGDLLNIA